MKEDSIPDATLRRFADVGTSAEERRSALTDLITTKVLPKLAAHPDVLAGRALLLEIGRHHPERGVRLLAIAESVRLAQVVRRWSATLAMELRAAFAAELPPMQLLGSADDRLNLARACSLQKGVPWLPRYLAVSIAEEEAGEKARAELVHALLTGAPALVDSFRELIAAFEELRPVTEAPGETVARRLTRTLAALRAELADSECEAGDGLGEAIYDLLALPLSAFGRPQDEKVQIDLAREALLLVHDVVRTRISAVADPQMYRAVEYCRRLCGGGSWPVELKDPLDRLTRDVTEALVLLGRQGKGDQGLLDQLLVLCNHPERARAVAQDLARRHPEIPEEIRDWLARGRARTARATGGSAAAEAAASSADSSIGLALQTARAARLLRDTLHDPLTASLELYEPEFVKPVNELLDHVQAIAVRVEQVAGLRAIDLLGTPGEEIEVAAKFFDTVGTELRQRMTVRLPAVVRMRSDGTVGEVVTKGLVD